MSHFPSTYVLLKLTDLVILHDPQASGFQKLAKLKIFDRYNLVLSIQNVNTARFARNVECDFFGDFQTLWLGTQVNYIVGITFFLLSVDFEGGTLMG